MICCSVSIDEKQEQLMLSRYDFQKQIRLSSDRLSSSNTYVGAGVGGRLGFVVGRLVGVTVGA